MKPQLFIDCDGVLADMDAGAAKVLGMHPRAYEMAVGPEAMWKRLHEEPDFYANLPVMSDAFELVLGVINLGFRPIILTGCPIGGWAEAQKLRWRDKHLPGFEMICCLSKDKRLHGKPGDILIDDWLKHRQAWVDMGGIWIHHTSAKESLNELSSISNDLPRTSPQRLER